MQSLLNSDAMSGILAAAQPKSFSNLIAANPAWKEEIEQSTKHGPVAVTVSYDEADERFSFCNTATMECPETHKPMVSLQDLQRLNELKIVPKTVQSDCNCDHDHRFPMESWNIKEAIQLEKISIRSVHKSIALVSRIRAECTSFCVHDSDLSDPSWTSFLSRILNSPKLKDLILIRVKLNEDTKEEILKTLAKGNLRSVWLPTIDGNENDLQRFVFGTLGSWTERTDSELQSAVFDCEVEDALQLGQNMTWMGMARHHRSSPQILVVEHPKIKGLCACVILFTTTNVGPALTIIFGGDSTNM